MPQTPDALQRSSVKLPAVLHGSGAAEFLETVKKAFHLSDVFRITIVDQVFEDKDTLLYFSFAREVPIKGREMGEASGIYAKLGGNLSLRFDRTGQLKSYELEDVTDQDVEAEKKGVVDLIKHDQLYIPALSEKVNVGSLISERKLFYVETGPDGKKRLVRTGTI